ncbi:MAG: hypothetical protein QOG94_929 [Solirubrobacteraceae bacterium]|nr:hypothetical protein [Solirubrobacteraceae bacterium]
MRIAVPTIVAVLAALLLAGVRPGDASARPGTPEAPTPLFDEDFESNRSVAVAPVTGYTGASPVNETYRTDPAYAPSAISCNGLITAFSSPGPGFCVSPAANAGVRLLARKLGVFDKDATPDDNHAVSAYTDQRRDPGANKVELQTVQPVALADAATRFVVVSADVAEANCAAAGNQPTLFAFFLLTGSADVPLASSPTDVCAKGGDLGDGVRGGRITSDGSLLFSGSQLGASVRNAQPSGYGNDHAFDNILVADASPQLDVAYRDDAIALGRTTSLTFTITNTAELAAKTGWSFSDALPAGLRVASPPAGSSTCPGAVVTAAPATRSVQAAGSLAARQASCALTVSVVAVAPGVARNAAAQLSTTGLREPATPAAVTITPTVTACADGRDNDRDRKVDRRDSGCTIAGAYLPSKDSEADVAPLAQCARGALRLTDVYGRGGRTVVRGIAGSQSVGATVAILLSGKRVAGAKVRGDLSFAATAALPRNTNAARYQARLDRQRSPSLTFARRMTETAARRLSDSRVRIGGRIADPLIRPAATVLVRASSRCPGRSFDGPVVASGIPVRPDGRWTATLTLPPSLRGARVFLRAETRGRVRSFSLIQGIALR